MVRKRELIYLYIFGKYRYGDFRFIVERSRMLKFLKNIFLKKEFLKNSK